MLDVSNLNQEKQLTGSSGSPALLPVRFYTVCARALLDRDVTENHNQSKCSVQVILVCPAPSDIPTTTQGTPLRRGQKQTYKICYTLYVIL